MYDYYHVTLLFLLLKNLRLPFVLCMLFIKSHTHLSAKLHERFHDPEESVRQETVHAVCEAAAESLEAIPKLVWGFIEYVSNYIHFDL